MIFKTPSFWYKKPSFLQKCLLCPATWIYKLISNYRYKSRYQVILNGRKIIAIGGITVGGAGKTVVVDAICKLLQESNKTVSVLSRGYGRSSKELLKVDESVHTYKDVGDEPLLLAKRAPVFVGTNRAATAQMADDSEYLILDDGLTQKYLKPTKKIVVISSSQQFGNGELLPLGPNRLDFNTVKSDTDALIVLRDESAVLDEPNLSAWGDVPKFYGRIRQNFGNLSGRLIVFCGLGYPQKFFKIFSNFEVAQTIAFPDHYPYKDSDMEKLIKRAFDLHAQLVTTEKDWVRIPKLYQDKVKTVRAEIVWENSISRLLNI